MGYQATTAETRRAPVLRTAALTLGFVLALLCWSPGPAAGVGPDEIRPHCEVCRRFWDTSPARITFTMQFSKTVKKYQVCSLFCYREFMEDYPDKEPEFAQIVNAATLDQELPATLRLDRAHYLYGAEGDTEKTNEPFVYAFATEDQAAEAQEELGGELLDYEDVLEKVTELTDEYEPDLSLHYSPKKRRHR